GALSFRWRVSARVFVPVSFLSPSDFPPRRTSLASCAAGNIQYTVILARSGDYVRLLSTLRADAIGKKETATPKAVPVLAVISRQETKNAKACVSHASERGRRGDRDRRAGDRESRRPGALAAGDELAKESRHALRRCRSYVPTRGADDRQEIPDPVLRWRGGRPPAGGLGCNAKRHRPGRPHAHLFQYRQETCGRVRFRARVRAQHAPAAGLDELRRRAGALPRIVQEGRYSAHSLRQCGRADGRLLSQGDQLRRRPQRAQVPHWRARRYDSGEA